MRTKKWGLLMGFMMITTSCSNIGQEEIKKIVLEEDVSLSTEDEKTLTVNVEVVDLSLEEGRFFKPLFYQEGKVYGEVGRGVGEIDNANREEFPVRAVLKDRLYCLDEQNLLKKTEKEVFTHSYGSTVFGYRESDIKYHTKTNILRIDYHNEDTPKVLKKFSKTLGENLKLYNNLSINEYMVDAGKVMYGITNMQPYGGCGMYFYDVEKDQLYSRENGITDENHGIYVPTLKTFIRIDEDYKCYKVVFKEDTFTFEEYLDFRAYINEEEDAQNIGYIPISDEEILIIEFEPFIQEEYFKYHPIWQTKRISLFNFATNEYEELLVRSRSEYMSTSYIGEVDAMGGKIIVVDTFEEDNGFIKPKERQFKLIEDQQLETVYTENIEDEGNTLSPSINIVVNEEGNELFLKKEQTVIERGVETSKTAVYKRYKLGK